MKEATGELNITVITVVAIAAVGAFFYAFIWPNIKKNIATKQCASQCGEKSATLTEDAAVSGGYSCACS